MIENSQFNPGCRNVELALTKVDLPLARLYSELVPDRELETMGPGRQWGQALGQASKF